MSNHLANVRKAMTRLDIPILVLTDTPNIAYVSGFRFTVTERIAVLLVPASGAVEIVLPYYEEQAARVALPHDAVIHVYNDEVGPESALKQCLAKLHGQATIGMLKDSVSLAHYEVIDSLVKPRVVADFSHELAVLRAAKDSNEVSYIRHAGEIADRTVGRLLEVLRPGNSEAELGGELSRIIRIEGGDGSAHVPNVTSGARSAFPHGPDLSRQLGVRPARDLVQEGELVILDFDVLVGGYCADISRTYVLGESKPKQREIYQIVVEAHRAAIDASVIGNTAADVDRAARSVIEKAGYGSLFPHKTGHGVGLQIHEEPSISTSNELPLTEGMVFTVEPAIYVPDYGGVRIEDVVLVTKHGPEHLATLDADVAIVGAPYDLGTQVRSGARYGPRGIRNASAIYGMRSVRYYDSEFDEIYLDGVRVVDVGDADMIHGRPDACLANIQSTTTSILDRGAMPVTLGGDHSVPIPIMRAFADHGPLFVVQIDAHLDFVDNRFGVTEGHGNVMRRISEMDHVTGLAQIGIRGPGSSDPSDFVDAKRSGSIIIGPREFRRVGVGEVLDRIPQSPRYYVTMDCDGFDAAAMPGTGSPSPGGLYYHEVVDLLRGLALKGEVVGFDFVEVAPMYDPSEVTAQTAARVILDFLGAIFKAREARPTIVPKDLHVARDVKR